MQTFCMIVTVLLAVYGAAELVYRLLHYLLLSPCAGWFVIPIKDEGNEAEYAIRVAWLQGVGTPLLLDCGLSEQGRAHVQAVAARLGVPLLSEKEIANFPLQQPKRGV